MDNSKKKISDLKVALAHDFLVFPGGAEKVLEALAEIFPQAPIYTLLYDSKKMGHAFLGREIRPSGLQKLPLFLRQRHRLLLPLLAPFVERMDFRDFDLVVSSSGAWTKGIITRLSTVHLAYLHSPMRFVWDYFSRYQEEERIFWKFGWRLLANYLRIWDRLAAERPDRLIANSEYTQERIRKYYRRESNLVYPPAFLTVPPEKIRKKGESGEYFLIVSRLSPYKKVELAVEAFNKLGMPLVVIGEGRERKKLERLAKSNIRIVGHRSQEELRQYYSRARALVFPGCDDFGMTMVEAMSFGVPAIAFREGGAREIVQEGETGEFFRAQTVEVLVDAVRRFIAREKEYDPQKIVATAGKFSRSRFQDELLKLIRESAGIE